MNSFFENNKQFFSFSLLLGLLLNSALFAITFRNEPLTNFVQPGEDFCTTFPENSIVILDMQNDNFNITHGNIEKPNNLKDIFQEVIAGRSGFSISSETCDLSSNFINYNSSYLSGRESMNIHAETSLKFTHCCFESPLILIAGSKMNFVDSFFINPEILNISIDSPGSDYGIIQILFYKQPENPTFITGEIDFTKDQTTNKLMISNVKEIRVNFVWDKSLPKKLNFKRAAPENNNSQPRCTWSQPVDNSIQKDILLSKQFIPVALSIALLACIAYHDMFL